MYTLHDMNAMQAHRLVSLGYDLRMCTCKHSPPRRVWKQKIHAILLRPVWGQNMVLEPDKLHIIVLSLKIHVYSNSG